MTILVLCWESNLCNTLGFYAQAFRRRGVRLVCAGPEFPWNGNVGEWLRLCPEKPALIWHPEADVPFLPWGLANVDVPTACFQVDTYAYTRRRISWSTLFDLVLVFHPGYEVEFREAGHPGARLMPHAVEAQLFSAPEPERVYEVGWVGQMEGPVYRARSRILAQLSKSFRMNELGRRYSGEELASTYRQSKIVVNIGRDDHPQDANVRTFEAMAAGTLLITSLPSELSAIGFRDGVHFVGYRNEAEITGLVRTYLADDAARRTIAEAAREFVLREHTYDRRIDTFLELLNGMEKKRCAPARTWPEERVRMAYLQYFAANGALQCALAELPAIARRSLTNAAAGSAVLARAWGRRIRALIRNRFARGPGLGASKA
jgi:Glycosyl transferases group 1